MIALLKFSDNPFHFTEVYVDCFNESHMNNIINIYFSNDFLQLYLSDTVVFDDSFFIPGDSIILL